MYKEVFGMTIGERVKQRRLQLGMSADDLAKKINKNRATVYRYESEYIEKLPTTILIPLAEALHTTPAYLMGWEEAPEYKKEDAVSDILAKVYSNEKIQKATSLLCELNDKQLDLVIAMISNFKQE